MMNESWNQLVPTLGEEVCSLFCGQLRELDWEPWTKRLVVLDLTFASKVALVGAEIALPAWDEARPSDPRPRLATEAGRLALGSPSREIAQEVQTAALEAEFALEDAVDSVLPPAACAAAEAGEAAARSTLSATATHVRPDNPAPLLEAARLHVVRALFAAATTLGTLAPESDIRDLIGERLLSELTPGESS